ncbi:MAG: hypothetical protein ACYTBS_22180 [Planctomycetota bacterium]|jgi:hypothetical protein
MTIFKDRLPGTIRIKKKFAPSFERVRISRNRVIQCFYIILALILLALFFHWLEL